jgi:hypothetical protein
MSTNPRDDERLAQISGAGIGPKNIRRAFSLPIARTNSCTVQYMAMRMKKNDLNGEEMRPDDFRQQLLIAGDKAARLPPEIDQPSR